MPRIVNITGGVIVACSMSQFPEYSQQYVQRLGGAVDELLIVVEDFDKSAKATEQSREVALSSMTGTEFLDRRQADMRGTISRTEQLTDDYDILREANAYQRLTYIARLTDTGISKRTWQDFQPAVPLTLDGLIFTVLGYLAGYTGMAGITGIRRGRRRRKARLI